MSDLRTLAGVRGRTPQLVTEDYKNSSTAEMELRPSDVIKASAMRTLFKPDRYVFGVSENGKRLTREQYIGIAESNYYSGYRRCGYGNGNMDRVVELQQDDGVTTIKNGTERFNCPEVLFKQKIMEPEQKGIHKLTFNNIMRFNEVIKLLKDVQNANVNVKINDWELFNQKMGADNHMNLSAFQTVPERIFARSKKAFDCAIQSLDKLTNENYKDSMARIQLLRDDLTLWTSDANVDINKKDGNCDDKVLMDVVIDEVVEECDVKNLFSQIDKVGIRKYGQKYGQRVGYRYFKKAQYSKVSTKRRVKRPDIFRKRKCLKDKAISGKIKQSVKKNTIRHRLRKICYNKTYTRPHAYRIRCYKTNGRKFGCICNRKYKFYCKWINRYTWKYKPIGKRLTTKRRVNKSTKCGSHGKYFNKICNWYHKVHYRTTRRRQKEKVASKVNRCQQYSTLGDVKCTDNFNTQYGYKWYATESKNESNRYYLYNKCAQNYWINEKYNGNNGFRIKLQTRVQRKDRRKNNVCCTKDKGTKLRILRRAQTQKMFSRKIKKCHELIWHYYKKCYPRRSFCKYYNHVRSFRTSLKHHRRCWSYLHPAINKYNIPHARKYCGKSKAYHKNDCTDYYNTYNYYTRCYNTPHKAKNYYTFRHCLRNIRDCAYNKCHHKYKYGYKTYFGLLRKRYYHTKQIKVDKYKRSRRRNRCRKTSRAYYSKRCTNVVSSKHIPHYVTRSVRKCRNVPHIARNCYIARKIYSAKRWEKAINWRSAWKKDEHKYCKCVTSHNQNYRRIKSCRNYAKFYLYNKFSNKNFKEFYRKFSNSKFFEKTRKVCKRKSRYYGYNKCVYKHHNRIIAYNKTHYRTNCVAKSDRNQYPNQKKYCRPDEIDYLKNKWTQYTQYKWFNWWKQYHKTVSINYYRTVCRKNCRKYRKKYAVYCTVNNSVQGNVFETPCKTRTKTFSKRKNVSVRHRTTINHCYNKINYNMKSKLKWYYGSMFRWIIQKYSRNYYWLYKYTKPQADEKNYYRKRNNYCNYRKCLSIYKYYWHPDYSRKCWKRKTKRYRKSIREAKFYLRNCTINGYFVDYAIKFSNQTHNKTHRKSIIRCIYYPKDYRNIDDAYSTIKCLNQNYTKCANQNSNTCSDDSYSKDFTKRIVCADIKQIYSVSSKLLNVKILDQLFALIKDIVPTRCHWNI